MRSRHTLVQLALAGLLVALSGTAAHAVEVTVTNLVSDNPALSPKVLDPSLVNPWGVSFSATSPFWVSNNGTGTATIYNVDPTTQATTKNGLTVAVPGDGSVTGQVFNGGAGFNSDRFLFVSEDGTVSGWRGALGTTAEILATASPNNVYKGAAIATMGSDTYLYAANFHTGAIDVYKGNVASPTLPGSFTDPNLPAGYAPFNIQNLNGTLYVTYALQGAGIDEQTGLGLGIVNRFDTNGNLLGRVATGGPLDAPWGLSFAPSSFGSLAGALLVGNFGDGRITAYDPSTNAILGQLLDQTAAPLEIDGLWALTVGNGVGAGTTDGIYFTAGPNNETHGLFGLLSFFGESPSNVPEPGGLAVLGLGLAGFAALRRRALR